jgi:signal transduction histidine kinase
VPALPLRAETIAHLALKPIPFEAHTRNKLLAADPGLVIAVLRSGLGKEPNASSTVPHIARLATPRVLYRVLEAQATAFPDPAPAPPVVARIINHSVAVAHAARYLTRTRRAIDPQAAYLLGLLHNLGLLAMAHVTPDSVAAALERASDDASLMKLEDQLFGTTHVALGRQLADRWGLPDVVRHVAWLHHNPALGLPLGQSDREVIDVVREADEWVGRSEFSLYSACDGRTLPWKAADEITSTVSRGVRQSETFLRDQAVGDSAETTLTPLARARQLAMAALAAQLDTDWEKLLWERYSALPVDATAPELTDLVAEVFVAATGISAALCSIVTESGVGHATLWADRPRRIDINLAAADNGEMSEQMRGKLGPLWKKLPYRTIALTDVPRAHVLCWSTAHDPWDDSLAGRVAERCAMLLRRAVQVSSLAEQCESMAQALREISSQAEAKLEDVKLAALAELAAGAAHEINNPLAVVTGRAQILLHDEIDPQRRKALETIVAQARRIHEMIGDLMLFARPPQPVREIVPVRMVVEGAVAAVRADAEDRQIRLTSQAAPDLPTVCVDLGQLVMAVACILKNSFEAVDADGDVEVSAVAVEGRIELRVRDNGPGIPESIRPHIFEPFFSGREAGRGLGLGLSKAWRIVKGHGGDIEVESGPTGTTVTLRLPADPAPPEQRACA